MNVGSETQRQWFKRPDDEKFASLEDLYAFMAGRKQRTSTIEARLSGLKATADEGELFIDVHSGVNRVDRLTPTNWGFSQLSSMVGAHPSYLSDLPARLAAECINHGITTRAAMRNRNLELMVISAEQVDGTVPRSLSAVTSDGYGRAWDAHSVLFAQEIQGMTNGRFQAPHDWGGVKRSLFAGDRDLHMLLVDGDSLVDGGGERDQLHRGFIIGNSEVGGKAWYFATFLFRVVCGNFGIHGLEQVSFFSIKHTMNAPGKIAREAMPHILKYIDASPAPLEQVVRKAKELVLPKVTADYVNYFKHRKFTGTEVQNAVILADKEEGKHDTLWDAYNGFTAVARTYKNADTAANLQQRAGKLLEQVAA